MSLGILPQIPEHQEVIWDIPPAPSFPHQTENEIFFTFLDDIGGYSNP